MFLFTAAAALGNTCTLVMAPANGNWPAITNGLRNLNAYGVQNSLWTTDNNPAAATGQRILYCTAGAGCTGGTIHSGADGLLRSAVHLDFDE